MIRHIINKWAITASHTRVMTSILGIWDYFLAESMPRHQAHIKLLKEIFQRFIERYPVADTFQVYYELVPDESEGDDQEFWLVFLQTPENMSIIIYKDTIQVNVGELYSVWDVNGMRLRSTCPLAERYEDLESYLEMCLLPLL